MGNKAIGVGGEEEAGEEGGEIGTETGTKTARGRIGDSRMFSNPVARGSCLIQVIPRNLGSTARSAAMRLLNSGAGRRARRTKSYVHRGDQTAAEEEGSGLLGAEMLKVDSGIKRSLYAHDDKNNGNKRQYLITIRRQSYRPTGQPAQYR